MTESFIARPAAALAAFVPAAVLASAVLGQTLSDPNPPAKWTPPKAAAKPQSSAPAKSCSAFGAGFVKVPGTDACVKIGGFVTLEGSAGR
jgi:hypothetical protein